MHLKMDVVVSINALRNQDKLKLTETGPAS